MGDGMGGGMGRISLRNLRTFSSLKNSAYRFYFLGMTGQWASMNMEQVTRSLLIYRLTGSAAILGLMALANGIPMLLFSLFGGVIADRVQKKYVLLAGLAGSALVSLGIALALTLGYLSAEHANSWWILIVASVLKATIQGLMMPSRQAIIPEVVSEGQVMNAMALNSLGMSTLRLLAPAAAGFLIEAFDFAPIYYVTVGLYLGSMVFIALMPHIGTITVGGRGALVDIKEGLQYMWRQPILLTILALTLVIVILAMPYQLMMPIFADDILKVGANGLGLLMSVAGAGAIIGSLILASLPNKRRGAILLASSLVLGLALAAFAFSRSWTLSLSVMLFVGLGQAGRQTLGSTLLQSYTDAEYLGRVMSINMMDMGLSSLGTFAAGLLVEGIGAQWAVGGFAMVLVFLTLMALVFLPQLRKLD